MPFVKRDAGGNVIAVFGEAQPDASEFLPPDSDDVMAFLSNTRGDESEADPLAVLLESDMAMGRVVEDLIDVLIEKNVIMLTDLPGPAQQKLTARRHLRSGILLGRESTATRMANLAGQVLSGRTELGLPPVLRDLEAVTIDRVRELAAELLARPLAIGAVGPIDGHRLPEDGWEIRG